MKKIAYQGEQGAYSHQACLKARPEYEPLPCRSFEDAIEAVQQGDAALAMLPVENSTFGRVADIHHLLPSSGLHIIDEAFVRVEIALLALRGVPLSEIQEVQSHRMLLGQARNFLRSHNIKPIIGTDTAGSARFIAEAGERHRAALASRLAGEVYGLDILADGIEDESNNTTRFLIMAREADHARRAERMITSFVFRVRNIPAALYKALGGFATNGINMTKLESYMVGGSFQATEFLAEVEGHPEDPALSRALDELRYFTDKRMILGVYPANERRVVED